MQVEGEEGCGIWHAGYEYKIYFMRCYVPCRTRWISASSAKGTRYHVLKVPSIISDLQKLGPAIIIFPRLGWDMVPAAWLEEIFCSQS